MFELFSIFVILIKFRSPQNMFLVINQLDAQNFV